VTRDAVLVTGGNSGIGFEAARELARAGRHVVIASRNRAASADAVRRIAAESGDDAVSELGLDLGSLAAVRRFAGELADPGSRPTASSSRSPSTTSAISS
jgi:NAD(P)-dependent dehydrogenase (short-subunit alcohol dehydrogenase family)